MDIFWDIYIFIGFLLFKLLDGFIFYIYLLLFMMFYIHFNLNTK